MEGKDGKLDINIDTIWNFLTILIRIFFFQKHFAYLHSVIDLFFIISFSVQVIVWVMLVLTYHYLYSYNLYYLVYWLVFYYNIFK